MKREKSQNFKPLTKDEMLAYLHSSESFNDLAFEKDLAQKSQEQIQKAEKKEYEKVMNRLKHELRAFFGKEMGEIEDDSQSFQDWQETLRIYKENLVEIQTVAVHNALAKVLGLSKK